MAEKLFFVNAVTGSPSYTAAEFIEYFEVFFNQGVRNVTGGALLVTAQTVPAMAVDVAPGNAHGSVGGGGFMGKLDVAKSLAIANNGSGSTRIDSIIFELDIAARTATVRVIQGTPGAGAPTLTNDSSKRQIQLADISVVNGATVINSGNITDRRTSSLPQVSLVGLATILDDPSFYF